VARVKRLTIVTAFPERRGGSDNVLWTFLRHCDRDRFDPLVIFLGSGAFEREVAALGIRTRSLPGGRLRNPFHVVATATRIAGVLRRERPDLLLNWLSTAQIYGGTAALLTRLGDRTVWWQHDLNRGRFGRGMTLDRLALLLPAIAVGACSRAAAEAVGRIRPRRETFVVWPGIDPPSDAPRAGAPEESVVPEGRFAIGSVGRLVEWKGHHKVLAAAAILGREGRDVHVLVIGGSGHRADGRYESTLRGEADRLGLRGRVTFTGQVADATSWIGSLDVLVNAAEAEPFGLVLLEAMALEVPVVAVSRAGPAEILEDGLSGVLVADATPVALAGGIRVLMDAPGERAAIASAGRERWNEHFTGVRMTREMEARLEVLAR
jgi:glycosyltransferase involved in cell wall biosynthesis